MTNKELEDYLRSLNERYFESTAADDVVGIIKDYSTAIDLLAVECEKIYSVSPQFKGSHVEEDVFQICRLADIINVDKSEVVPTLENKFKFRFITKEEFEEKLSENSK